MLHSHGWRSRSSVADFTLQNLTAPTLRVKAWRRYGGIARISFARLAPANPPNDGKQTPMRGHPVFVAQHACACCCRNCLAKWWKVPRGVSISHDRQKAIVDFLMTWIGREID